MGAAGRQVTHEWRLLREGEELVVAFVKEQFPGQRRDVVRLSPQAQSQSRLLSDRALATAREERTHLVVKDRFEECAANRARLLNRGRRRIGARGVGQAARVRGRAALAGGRPQHVDRMEAILARRFDL